MTSKRILPLVLAGIVACVPIARAEDHVRVGKVQANAWTMLPVDIAQDEGFFAKEGLSADIVSLGGDAKVQQALAADSIDFGLASGPGMALAAKGGLAIAVAAFAGAPRNMSVVTLTDSPIKTVADLRGKLLAVSTAGSLSEWLAKQIAIREGWDPDGIRTVALGPAYATDAALEAHQVDAEVGGAETGIKLEDLHKGRMLTTMEPYAPLFITHVVFTQRALIDKNPALVSRFLKGFFAAIAFIKTHRAETAVEAQKVLHEDTYVINTEYEVEEPIFITDGTFDPRAIAVLKKSFVEMGAASAPTDNAMFTTQFVPVKP